MSIADRFFSPAEEAAEGHGFGRPNRTDTPTDRQAAAPTPEAGAERIELPGGCYWQRFHSASSGHLYELMMPDGSFVDANTSTEADARLFAVALSAHGQGAGVAVASFQARVAPWVVACFGDEVACDELERMDRFVEEVFEAVQSRGYDPARIDALKDYVYGREPGETRQEIGGTMMTLAAWCNAIGQDMHEAGEAELTRVWGKVETIRAKQAAKPKGSALPIAAAPRPQPAPAGDARSKDWWLARARAETGCENVEAGASAPAPDAASTAQGGDAAGVSEAFCPQSTPSDHLDYLMAFVDGSHYPAEVKSDAEKTIATLRALQATPADVAGLIVAVQALLDSCDRDDFARQSPRLLAALRRAVALARRADGAVAGVDVSAELRRLSERATGGRSALGHPSREWKASGRYIGTRNHMSYIGEVRDQSGNWSDTEKSTGDAKFIVAAVNDLRARIEAEDRARNATGREGA